MNNEQIPESVIDQTNGNILEFLLGEKPFNNIWFGETQNGKVPFWWRKHLREYIEGCKSQYPFREKCEQLENNLEIAKVCWKAEMTDRMKKEKENTVLRDALEKIAHPHAVAYYSLVTWMKEIAQQALKQTE